jgi:predicted DNA-binding mobile mystery protein A
MREVRGALGMTAAQLASRLGIKQPTLSKLERSEARGTITLESLRKAARALDCELVYALVPRRSLQERIAERVRQVAHERVSRVSHTMRLEEQGVDEEHERQQEEQLVQRMLHEPPRNLWE